MENAFRYNRSVLYLYLSNLLIITTCLETVNTRPLRLSTAINRKSMRRLWGAGGPRGQEPHDSDIYVDYMGGPRPYHYLLR